MSDPITAIIAAAKWAVATWQAFAAAHPIIAAGIKLAVSVGLGALGAQPEVPRGAAGRVNVRQTRPARRFVVGRARVAGAYTRAVVVKETLHRVLALPEWEIATGRTWLHDDEVRVVGGVVQPFRDKRYDAGLIQIETRTGFSGQTAYAGLVAVDAGWTNDHRGEGVPSAWIACRSGGLQSFNKRYPSGAPEYNRESFGGAYDWRDPDQKRDDPTTWKHTRNWLVWFVNVLWRVYGQDWDRRFAPTLDQLTAEADICDEPVSRAYYSGGLTAEVDKGATVLPLTTVAGLAVGSVITLSGQAYTVSNIAGQNATVTPPAVTDYAIGDRGSWAVHPTNPVTEPRYEIGFWFEANTPARNLIKTFVAAADGHLSVRRDGAFIIRCGHYEAPTVIFGEKELIDWSFNPGPLPDEAINTLTLSFTDPDAGYQEVDTDPRVDEAAVEATGMERAEDFSPSGVQSNGQLGRCAKALLDRLRSPDGTFRTPLSARRGFGQRFIGIRNPECEDLFDAVVEIVEYNTDFNTGTIVWSYNLVDPAKRHGWDPAIDEGPGPITGGQGGGVAVVAPLIVSLTPFEDALGSGGNGVRLHVVGTGPDRSDLTWYVQTRTTGSTSWNPAEVTDTEAGVGFTGDTGFVTAAPSLDVQLGYQTGGGNFVWSTTTTVNTSAETFPPSPPTELAVVAGGGAGEAAVSWRNPSSANLDHLKLYRGTSSSFGSASQIGSDIVGGLGAPMVVEDTPGTGTFYYWVRAFNAAAVGSAPVGPVSITL